MDTCETVQVVADNDDGYMVINKSDLTDEHELYDAPEAPEATEIPTKIADIRAALTERGIEFDADLGKPELKELLESAILAESD